MAEPVRTCVGCRRQASQRELIRVVSANGHLQVSRRAPGRGAWLCADAPGCAQLAMVRNAWSRALRTSVSPGQAEALLRQLEEAILES